MSINISLKTLLQYFVTFACINYETIFIPSYLKSVNMLQNHVNRFESQQIL